MNAINQQKEKIASLFKKPLPGVRAQKQMAPSLRKLPDLTVESETNRKKSAVMIVLFKNNGELSILFIKRPEYDGHHSGQVAFPGGKTDENDTSLLDTAIRECKEEVGIEISATDIVGTLSSLHIPVSNIMVFPFVAFLQKMPTIHPDNYEVAYTFIASISDLKKRKNHKIKHSFFKNTPITIPFFSIQNEEIWGATAMICSELLAVLTT